MSETTNPPAGETTPETPASLTPQQVETKVSAALAASYSAPDAPDLTVEQRFAVELLNDAIRLRDEGRTHLTAVDGNRSMLRNLAKTGKLTPTQTSAVGALYPLRERKQRATPTPPEPSGEQSQNGTTPPENPPESAGGSDNTATPPVTTGAPKTPAAKSPARR